MGFIDKVATKSKSAMKRADSKMGESIDVGKIKSKISDEKNKVKENYMNIGKKYYKYSKDGSPELMGEIEDLVAAIDESRKLIEQYEAEIETVKAKGKEEREGIRAQADAELAQKEAAKAEAAKEAEAKDDDDLFD